MCWVLALYGLEVYLHGLGYSVHFLSEVRRVARGFALRCVGVEAVVGGHGRYRCSCRSLQPLSRFKSVGEVGVDFLFHGVLPKIHVKIYTAKSPCVQRIIPLTAWARLHEAVKFS
jgi:hypothetical protein